jgi:hypothetical protein
MKCKATIRSPYQGGRPLPRQRSYPREHTSSFVWPSRFPREIIDPPARIRAIASNHHRRAFGSTRNSPYHVNCFSLPILLQHQNTRSFGVVGIFLYQLSRPNSLNYVAHVNLVFGKLSISMLGNYDFAASHQVQNPIEKLAHAKNLTSEFRVGQRDCPTRSILMPAGRLFQPRRPECVRSWPRFSAGRAPGNSPG